MKAYCNVDHVWLVTLYLKATLQEEIPEKLFINH